MPRFRLPTTSGLRTALTPVVALDQAAARARGLSRRQLNLARSWHLDLLPSLRLLEAGLILDIGAHEGLWTRDVLELVPGAQVIAVEPQDALRERIVARFRRDPRVTVDGRALTVAEGEGEFYLTAATVNGSLRAPRESMETLYDDGWVVEGVVTVPTTTVDELTAGRDVALLKIDVQGAEHDVLAGAKHTLSRTGAVMLEVTFVSHYEGDATFPALHELMETAGFVLTGISEPARSPAGAMLTADAAYVSAALLDVRLRENAR